MQLYFDADETINLKYISNDDLLFRTESLVQTERKIMHLVLTHILEIMNRRLYAELGFDSMYALMIKKYGYSETSALRRIDAAKLLRSVPEVADRLKAGSLNLSQAVQLQKCLASEAKKGEVVSETRTHEILESIKNCNSFETRQVLAQEFDIPIKINEIVRPQKDGSVRLEMTFTKEQYEELKQAKSYLSHIAHTGSWAEVISVLACKLNQSKMGKQNNSDIKSVKELTFKNTITNSLKLSEKSAVIWDQSLKSKNLDPSQSQADIVSSSSPSPSLNSPIKHGSTPATEVRNLKSLKVTLPSPPLRRSYISVSLKRKLYAQAQGCCQYHSPEGNRCGSQFQIQIDHVCAKKHERSLRNARSVVLN